MLNNRVYDILKWIVILVSPSLCTLLVTLNSLWKWNIPIEAIVGSITAVTTFVGAILKISSTKYNQIKEGDQ